MPEQPKIQFTPAQAAAIRARGGSLLVSAAAGSGKTRVLVERVVGLITDPEHPADADSLLIMTFTNAAAAKLRAQRLAARQTPPFYFNLDYLSAEDWVEGSHNMVGLHPRLDLPKLWFFPGVTDRTGGVLIEDDYEKRQQAFALQKKDFLLELGADPQRTTVFIFTYPVNDLQTAAAALRQPIGR